MKGVRFDGERVKAEVEHGTVSDLRSWRIPTGAIIFLFLVSSLGTSGVVVASPGELSVSIDALEESHTEIKIGALTLEVISQTSGYEFAYLMAGAEHRYSIVDDREGIRYSIDGGPWRSVALWDERSSSKTSEGSPSDQSEDTEFHFRAQYWWDGVRFMRGYPAVYPHPDRGYYHVVAKNDWRYWGIQLLHFQFGTDNVGLAVHFGPYVLGALIGGTIGTLVGGVFGTAVGTILGAVIGGLLAYYYNVNFVDEAGSLWWWVNKSFFSAIKNIPWWMWFCGRCVEGYIVAQIDYLRVGNLIAHNDLGIRGP